MIELKLKINSSNENVAPKLELIKRIIDLIINNKTDELKFIVNNYVNSTPFRSVNILEKLLYNTDAKTLSDKNDRTIWDNEFKKILHSKNWIENTFHLMLSGKDLSVIKKIKLNKESKIASIGSCFARNISRQFQSFGYYNIHTVGIEENVNSPRLINIYLNPNLKKDTVKQNWEGRLGFEPKSLSELITKLDLLIITFGVGFDLVNNQTNEIISNVENVSENIKNGKYIFKAPTIDEQTNYICSSIKNIKKINPSLPIFITISPVPLSGYVGANHVFTANTISKANLVLSLEEAKKSADFTYIPIYELIMLIAPVVMTDNIWGDKNTRRHPNEDLVKKICEVFINLFNKDN
jgi:hypothetical protein